ncbi:hypothetical protein M8J76_014106 [Diaphorina citri]|nr:hypothetical protein M8J75_012430 [Diaphorina citri]KAI5741488.1 hypothetical protein M8J76_014106 [Diaphorina citri]KAI5746766.1 hypothetical protein M8J77_007242 [Diaphorina citri]
MGPRTASMRHINVDMAPALTESSQSHEFVLPAKHKPLLTLHFAPSVLSKPMDDFTTKDPTVIKDTFNGLTFSAFKFTHVEKSKAIEENVDNVTMNSNGGKDNINMGHTDEHKVDHDMDQLLKNVPNSVLMDVIKDAIHPENNIEEEQPLPNSQNSEEKFEHSLFENVDVAKICDEGANSIVVDNTNKNVVEEDTAINSRIELIQKKKELVEKRLKSLLQGACRIHTRLIGTHASSEINLVLECISQSYLYGTADSSVGMLMQQLENSIQQQQTVFTPANAYFGSADVDKTDLIKTTPSLVKLNPEYQRTLEEVPGHLQTQLKAVQTTVDSDATASSSEAESCDERESFSNSHQLELPIHKRAAWRWNKDRTRLGGKWSWLLTQIGDVESRLRDYQHAARKLRASRLSAATPTTSVNGFHGVLPSTVPSESDDVCVSCARTRGFDPSAHRKRKVYKIRDLTRTHTKLNVPAPVRCGCTPPRPPCALCAGRPDPTKPRSGLCLEGKRSRIALVDTAYHPNSSFDTDVSRRVHLEAVMCTPWWQSRPQPFSLKQRKLLSMPPVSASPEKSPGPTLKKHTNSLPVPLSNEVPRTKRKYTKRRKTTSTGPSSSGKIGSEVSRPVRPKRTSSTPNWNHLLLDDEGEEDEPMEEDSGDEYEEERERGGYNSPVPSPSPSNTGKESRTRRRESSYDIDNIVIPYSVAATTRVEVLQYKEIPTPKWRIIDDTSAGSGRKNGDLVTPLPSSVPHFPSSDEEEGGEEEVEDISDETLMRRHEKYELEERKKFRSYVLPGYNISRRAHKRTDSRAESSGANTPDAQSPKHQPDLLPPTSGDGTSPLTSPPLSSADIPLEPKRRSLASRTVTVSESSSREEQVRCTSPESMDEVSPYSPLQFPLSDEQYAHLLKDMPPGHPTMENRNYSYEDHPHPPPTPTPTLSTQVSRPDSPAIMSDSGDSSEDPNDPEWTFESTKPPPSERYNHRNSKVFEY